MLRSTASKVMWVGRATVFLVGLAVILALTVGVVSKATAHTGSAGLFHLAHSNAASAISTLAGTVSNGMLQVTNNSTATTAKGVGITNKSAVSPAVRAVNTGGGPALGLSVGSGKAPMTVSSGAAKVTNLDADKVDGQEADSFATDGELSAEARTRESADTTLSNQLSNHDHDSRYYTEAEAYNKTEVDTALSGKANTNHQHTGTDIESGTVEADLIEDGTGSNLNADQLDGQNSTDFAAANHSHSTSIGSFVGYAGSSIAGSSTDWVFVGSTAQVTVSSGQRLTGSAVGVVALGNGTAAQSVDVGLCYRPSAGGTVNNFAGDYYTSTKIGDQKDTIAAAASVAPAAGTYNVGFCVRNYGPAALTNNGFVNGWVMVTNT